MAQILDNGFDLDVLRVVGEFVVTNPTGGSPPLDPATYFIRVVSSVSVLNDHFLQQIAYRISDGVEFFRANFGSAWTIWLPRDTSSGLTGAEIVSLIDGQLGSTAWRDALTGAQVVSLIDAYFGSTEWQQGGTQGPDPVAMAIVFGT